MRNRPTPRVIAQLEDERIVLVFVDVPASRRSCSEPDDQFEPKLVLEHRDLDGMNRPAWVQCQFMTGDDSLRFAARVLSVLPDFEKKLDPGTEFNNA